MAAESSTQQLKPMARRGIGTRGTRTQLYTNHFKVSFAPRASDAFFQYDVRMSIEDSSRRIAKAMRMKVMEKIQKTYGSNLGDKFFAFDGESSIFTFGELPEKNLSFIVFLDAHASRSRGGDAERKRKRQQQVRVDIRLASKISISAIVNARNRNFSEDCQDALRVLDILLRHHATKQNCICIRQAFFTDEGEPIKLGGALVGSRGFISSFKVTQDGLFLNMDSVTTVTRKPCPVNEFLLEALHRDRLKYIERREAEAVLRNLRVRVKHLNKEFKITGLSEKPCSEEKFLLKVREGQGERETTVTVLDYYKHHKKMRIDKSADFYCINVGTNRKTYFPLELCELVPLQRYTKALSVTQRSKLISESRQNPESKKDSLSDALDGQKYNNDPIFKSFGISIDRTFLRVDSRKLEAPQLLMGNNYQFRPQQGRWNFNDKQLLKPMNSIRKWAAVDFSGKGQLSFICDQIVNCGYQKGLRLPHASEEINERPKFQKESAETRVSAMIDELRSSFGGNLPEFVLCVLSQPKNCQLYGPWKHKCLFKYGIVTQCLAPKYRPDNQYFMNLLLKINAKMGGMNSCLSAEKKSCLPTIRQTPTLILGMDVSHGSPNSDNYSVASVVGSRCWPSISCYRAIVQTQAAKQELVQSLYKPQSDRKDEGIIRSFLNDFMESCNPKRLPDNIIIFRDGVSESQFLPVLNVELDQIKQACEFVDRNWKPKFTVIVAQKRHSTKFFVPTLTSNVPPGTVVDTGVCHPRNNDFYMFAHRGAMGTTKPTHYHVLLDEINFSADDLQELVHSLCYVYQRSTTAISLVAPICYAHHAAAQIMEILKHKGRDLGKPGVLELHRNLRNTMFFC